jgi:hypothetical protein
MFQQQCKSGLVASVSFNTLLRLSENMIHVDVPGALDVVISINGHEVGSLSIVGIQYVSQMCLLCVAVRSFRMNVC